MKVLKNEVTADYHEITVQSSFMGIKWQTTYRKQNGSIMRFKTPDKYYDIGLVEYSGICGLFKHLSKPVLNPHSSTVS